MDATRYEHYQQAMALIARMAPAKLHPHERACLEDAAEGALLCRPGEDPEVLFAQAREQLEALTDCERWLPESADALLAQIEAAGPQLVPA